LSSPVQLLLFLFHCCLLRTHTSIHWQCKQLSSFIDVQIYFFFLLRSYTVYLYYIFKCMSTSITLFGFNQVSQLVNLPNFSSVTFIASIVRFYLHTHMHIAHTDTYIHIHVREYKSLLLLKNEHSFYWPISICSCAYVSHSQRRISYTQYRCDHV